MPVLVGGSLGITFPNDTTTLPTNIDGQFSPHITNSSNRTTVNKASFIGDTGVQTLLGIANNVYTPTVVENGLLVYLDAGNAASYPGSGTTWFNLVGGGSNATLTNGPNFTTADGGAIVFDGNNDYVALPTINTNSDFTLAFWTTNINGGTLFSGTPEIGYLQIRNGTDLLSLVRSFTQELGNFGATTGTLLNTPYNIVLTKSGTTFSAYINGSFKNTLTVTGSFTTTSPALGINTSNSEAYRGRIMQFYYYNRPLATQEVLQNYNVVKSRFGL